MNIQTGLRDCKYNLHAGPSSAMVPSNTISAICSYKKKYLLQSFSRNLQ